MINPVKMALKAAAICAAGAITAAPSISQAETWDMAMAYSTSNFHTQLGQAFADAVRTATGGEVDIVVHGGGSLYKGSEIKRAVQAGQVPIGERILSAHQNEDIMFGADSLPFLAPSFADTEEYWKLLRPVMQKTLDKHNLVLLYSVPWPPQGLYFDKEINSVADMKGIKFRAYNSATARMAELAGMQPVQIEAAELTQALATGVASAFVSSGSTGYDRKVWEQLSHFYDVEGWLPRNYVFVNKDTWDGLDETTQNVIMGVAQMTERAGIAKSEQLADWYKTQLAANGMTVSKGSEQLQADLKAIGDQMIAEWLEKAGEEGQALVDAYRNK